jgi:two-component system chemotaxis sensor kinase CheA
MGEATIIEVFREEAREILQNLEEDILSLEEEQDQDVVNRLFRAFHTLKGSSGIAGFDSVSEFTHAVESRLDKVRGGSEKVSRGLIDMLLQSLDWVREALFGDGEDSDRKNAIIGKLNGESALAAAELMTGAVQEPSAKYYRVAFTFREDIFNFGIDPLSILEDLEKLGSFCEIIVRKQKINALSSFDPEKCDMSWIVILETERAVDAINAVFMFVRDDNEIVIDDITSRYSPKNKAGTDERIGDILVRKGILTDRELESVLKDQDTKNLKVGELIIKKGLATSKELSEALNTQDEVRKKIDSSTVRVDTVKLDGIMNLLGEIVIGQSGISRLVDDMDDEKGNTFKNALYGLDRITREFQEQIMSIRMIQVGPTFAQFRRIVRDMSKQEGKSIHLEVRGAETELDKTVIEKISDPLKHMIRNAVGHGIESPDERERAGKNPEATISLNAYHQEGNVYIEVSDDGRGLDLDRIKERALLRGLLKKGEDVPREKLVSMIFMPGFSTTDSVGELSGRGVGMDVVKNNISDLRGTVDIVTEKGKGTTIRIKLPLTMAIIEGMLCRVGRSVFIIPLLSIVESIKPKREDIRSVEKQGEVVQVRGEYVSLIRLYDYYGIKPEKENPWDALLIIVESTGTKLALMVDDLIGQQQVVIKSLDSYITKDRSISGAAIMGDGTVALIVDIHGLLNDLSGR